jgi:hypothetical protein
MGLFDSLQKLIQAKDDRGIRTRPEKLDGKTIIVLVKESYKTKAAYDMRKNAYCVIFRYPESNERYFFETAGKVLKYQMSLLLKTDLVEVPLKIVMRRSQKGPYGQFVAIDETMPKELQIKFR